ncbi:MAG: hypothetical protein ACW98Y_09465 [Candidatus Thorarchaeota archaeon]|jgi:hypothetical protein
MEDRRIDSGDFDVKMRNDRSAYPKYFAHGLVLSVSMSFIVSVLSLISDMFSTGFDYLTIYINNPPPSTPSPIITGIFLINFSSIGLLFLFMGFGALNLYLTERIWNQNQKKTWFRQIGVGVLLLVCLLTYHVGTFFLLSIDGYGFILFALFQFVIFPMIDGVIGLNVTTLRFD